MNEGIVYCIIAYVNFHSCFTFFLKIFVLNTTGMAELTKDELKKQEDFNEEIIPHLDALYNFGLRLTSDPNDAEDLVQDTVVKAYRFFSSYEKGTNAKAWLFRILKNSYINNYRKKSKKPQEIDYDEVATFYETIRAERTETSDLENVQRIDR